MTPDAPQTVQEAKRLDRPRGASSLNGGSRLYMRRREAEAKAAKERERKRKVAEKRREKQKQEKE